MTKVCYANVLDMYGSFQHIRTSGSWLILKEGSQLILARLERQAFCFGGSLFWCSTSMLFCCTAVCRPLTVRHARTEDYTHLIAESIFSLPWNGAKK